MNEDIFKLDEFDRRMLYELDIDSRMPISSLAKKLRRSKPFVIFRLKRLENSGVITQYPAIVDMSALGYFSFRIYLRFQQMTQKQYSAFIEHVKKIPEVWTLTQLHGKWDLAIFMGTQGPSGVHAAWDEIVCKFKGQIAAYNFSFYAPIYDFNRTFFLKSTVDAKIFTRTYGEGKKVELDEKTSRILKEYSTNVRQSSLELSRKLGLQPNYVRKKLAWLDEKKIICGYHLGLDIAKLGFTTYRMDLELKSFDRKKELFEYCRQHPNIHLVQDTVGHSDFETALIVKDLPHLLSIIDDIQVKFKDTVNSINYFSYAQYHALNYIPG